MTTTTPHYDVAIIGSGPAGIFAALELLKHSGTRVVIFEKGKDLPRRRCPIDDDHPSCINCAPCDLVSGWGGAGAFSDGKITLTTEFGGILDQYLPKPELETLIHQVDQTFVGYGGDRPVYGLDSEKVKEIIRKAATADLSLIPARIRHLGTERCYEILKNMREDLRDRVDLRFRSPVAEILVDGERVTGVETEDGKRIGADYVISGPGREGAEWFSGEAERLNLGMSPNPVDIGVRVEVPAVILEHLTDVVYESKMIFYSKSFDDRVRTFCMNPYGEVVVENTGGVLTVNGHSYAEKKTENTNFALLVSKTFTEPFKEPLAYGKYVARLANLIGGGVIVQRLGDLLAGRRSTQERIQRGLVRPTLRDATPGDLSLVLPYRHLVALLEMLEALDSIAPGVHSRHTLLYGVEVKYYSARICLSPRLETGIENLFAVGDGAGVTRGLAQAAVSGVVAGREIISRLEKRAPSLGVS
ncbi:MAG: NAD(P)/FAD-dependent oxidoreductase [Firmicutes bacterium]|nr:NAD(P)/FAD-dependent oxidoreductase [Bacillota bacterium]